METKYNLGFFSFKEPTKTYNILIDMCFIINNNNNKCLFVNDIKEKYSTVLFIIVIYVL